MWLQRPLHPPYFQERLRNREEQLEQVWEGTADNSFHIFRLTQYIAIVCTIEHTHVHIHIYTYTMCRIHPADNRCQYREAEAAAEAKEDEGGGGRPWVLTVWKRSSMSFQGTDGFTVFDCHGRLAFRVDNYTRNRCCAGGLVLMDGAGNPLLTLKPQMLSMQCQWNGYRGEDGDQYRPKSPKSRVFAMRRRSALIHATPCEAEVFMGGHKERPKPDFRIEGSFRQRSCKIRTATGQLVAKIARKRVSKTVVLGDDVFSLVVQPGFDPELVMAFVVILDRICNKPFTPVLCS